MKNKRPIAALIACLLIFFLFLAGCTEPAEETDQGAATEQTTEFAGGNGSTSDPWQIATPEQLAKVNDHLDAHFVLTANIDLGDIENWEPLGTFVATEEDPEDAKPEYAFTGSFDGANYTVSNLQITGTEMAVGLFGCITGENAEIKNLTIENATVEGGMAVGALAGFGLAGQGYSSITLTGQNTISGTDMVGGLFGGVLDGEVKDCTAVADVTFSGSDSQGAGIIVGGMEGGSMINCKATGSIAVSGTGNNGIGGLAGCAFDSSSVENCEAEVTIEVGENNVLIGGLLGFAGKYEGEVTNIVNCTAKPTITAPKSAERIGGIIGGGLYTVAYKEYYPEPSAFAVKDCTATGTISGGSIVGFIAGYTYNNSTVEACEGEVVDGNQAALPDIGATVDDIGVDRLQ